MRRPPMGAKMMPMMKRVGKTVLGVRIGCHALRRCCLKAVSATAATTVQQPHRPQPEYILAGRRQLPFSFFLSGEELESLSSPFFRLKKTMELVVSVIWQCAQRLS